MRLRKSRKPIFIVRLCQSRSFLFVLIFIFVSITISYYLIKNPSLKSSLLSNRKEQFESIKYLLINDRMPTYKLTTYDEYQYPLERTRAQTQLFTHLKFKEKCQSNNNTVVFDIGASLGEFGFYAAACGCQVYMFEIDPKKLLYIEKTIEINSFESRIHLIKKAVSDIRTNKSIYFTRKTDGKLADRIPIDKHDPDLYTGETIYLNQYDFPLLKSIYFLRIDVQGHELHVMRSMEKYFQKHLIDNLLFEYTPWENERNFQKDIFNYLNEILHAKQFYALHPKQSVLYGPLNPQDIQHFYSDHLKQRLQRDIYVLFYPEHINLTAHPYQFQSSF